MVVDFSKINLKERPMLVLKTQSDEVIQTLGYAFNVEADLMYNEVSTLTFDLPAYVNGVKTPNYDEVKGTRIIDFVGVGLFILVDPTTENDGVSEIKHCKAYSLEYEFTKKQFYIAGNEDDPDEDGNVGYKMVYKFYDGFDGVSNTETIIGRIHEKMPEWTFEIVDADLYDKYRTFDSDVSDNVYNFIKSTVQETYGCIFDFDTYNRHVKVISTESAIAQRQVFLSQENLIKKIDINEDSDSVVTSLDVSGEEGVSIRFVNPTGQNNIYDLHYFLDELPASLRTKWNEWTAACEAQRQNYFNLAMSYQVKIADILAEQVKLVDLQGELKTAETIQGAEVTKPDHKQSDLDNASAEVTRATNAVNAQQSVVNTKTAAKDSVLDSIKAINYSLAWEPVKDSNGNIIGGPWKDSKGQAFTAAELKTLRRYFFEDSVEDSSFALATTNSYTNKDIGSSLSNITINISNSKIERANSSSPMYSFTGGKIKVGTSPSYVSAKIVRGTAEVDPSTKKVILTAYLERGDYSQTDFEDEGTGRSIFDCGTITLTGTYTTMTYNGSTTPEGIYSGTSLVLNKSTVNVYFTKNTSEFEQYSVEWDLFNYGKEILEERSEPSYTFTVESGNFLVIDDFFQFQNDLKLGQRVYLNLDDTKKVPFVTSVHLNYEDLSDFKIEFCNTYRASDSSFRLSQLLEQSIRLGKSLNIKGGMYSQFQATGAQNAVKEFMNSALDIAKNNVLSSENQAITFDESGLRLRKWKDKDAGTYEDEQIWMNDNTIAFTDDNWSTAKMAIGKIIDTSLFGYVKTGDKKRDTSKTYYTKQSDGTYREWTGSTTWNTNLYEKGYAYGIAAPYLVGTVLAGSNLIITADGHTFRIDGNGIRIKTNSLLITSKDDTDPKTFEQTQKETKEAAVDAANVYTDGEFDDFMEVYDHGDDNVIVTFYGKYNGDGPKEAEKGDLWYYENSIDDMPDASKGIGGIAAPVTVGTLKRCTGAYILKAKTDIEANRVRDFITLTIQSFNWKNDRNKLEEKKVYYVIDNVNGTSPKIYLGTATTVDGKKVIVGTEKTTWTKKLVWDLVKDEDAIRAVQSAADARLIADNRINTFYSDTEPDGVYIGNVKVIDLGHGDLWYKTVPDPPGDIKPGDTDERTSPPGDGRKFGKMYWYDKESDPDNPSWEPVTDGEVLRFITENANSIRNDLKQLMAVMDDKMNVFFIDDTKAFPTISGDELDDDDILFREGKNNRSWKPASTTYSTKPNHVYRIKVSTASSGAKTVSNVIDITDELDDSTKESLRMARSFQNTVDKKGTIYARPTPPGSQDGDETMNASDDGDLWICTRDPNDPPVKSNLVSGGEYRGGKMYRWDTSKWYVIEDPDLDAKATELGRRMKELMQVLDPGDTDMNLFWMLQNDTFSTITAGAQNGDLLFFAGTKNKTVTVNGTSKTLNPDSLYRIVVEENVITALNKETDADAKDAIKSARNFQNFTDHKSRVYAQPQPPDTSTMKETDNGDIWICTFTSGEPISQGNSYIGGKMYRFDYNGGNGRWVEIHDPDLDKEVFDYGQTIRELMQAMDNQINVYELGAGDDVPTIAKGLEDGDIIYVKSDAGNKTISINGKSETLQAGHLYRIFTDGSKVTGKEEIEDDNAKKAIIAAGSWKNLEDKKVTVYVLDHLPGTATGETPLKKADGGDIWFCTKDIDTNGDGKADYVKDKIYRMVWSNGVTWVLVDPYSQELKSAFGSIEELRKGLDNKITTYYMNSIPQEPEDGDLLFYTGTEKTVSGVTFKNKHLYRYRAATDTASATWEEIQDQDIVTALEDASDAFDLADKKAQTFWDTKPPTPTEHGKGDLWYCTMSSGSASSNLVVGGTYEAGRLYYCDEVGSGSSKQLKWRILDDKVLSGEIAELNVKYGQTMIDVMLSFDSRDTEINIFQKSTIPTISGDSVKDNDLFLYTGSSKRTVTIDGETFEIYPNRLYRASVSSGKITAWTEMTDNTELIQAILAARSSQDILDGKAVVYYQNTIPSIESHSKGDLWYNTATTGPTGYEPQRMYYCTGTSWVLIEDKGLSDRIDKQLEEAFESIEKLREGLDNKITTFYQDTEPSDAENGDLWFYNGTENIKIGTKTVTKGKVYRLKVTGPKDNPTKVWEELTDPKIAQALEKAAQAQNTADGKAHTWWSTTPPIPHEGDDGDLWYCTLGKGESGYSDYVDESATANPKRNYFGGRLYYCTIIGYDREEYSDGGSKDIPILAWKLLEDKVLAEQIDTVSDTLEDIYNGQTLVKDKFPKTIEAQYMAMKAAGGNVVYDSYGVWLLDKATNGTSNTNKANATEAVWMNEDGILFGHSAKTGDVSSDYEKEMSAADSSAIGLSNKKWYWTTAINHAGITAKALVGQTLQGVHILGDSDLQIGAKTFGNDIKYAFKVDEKGQIFAGLKSDGSDYNFKVNSNGDVTVNGNGTFTGRIEAESGNFHGTLYANDIKTPNGNSIFSSGAGTDNPVIDKDYLELQGLKIKDGNGDVAIDLSGSGIKFNTGAISWSSINTAGSNIAYKSDIPAEQSLDDYVTKTFLRNELASLDIPDDVLDSTKTRIATTYLNNVSVTSPNIIGGTLYAYGSNGTGDTSSYYIEITGTGIKFYNDSQMYFSVSRAGTVTKLSQDSNASGLQIAMENTTFSHAVTFNSIVQFNGQVYGLEATATFG